MLTGDSSLSLLRLWTGEAASVSCPQLHEMFRAGLEGAAHGSGDDEGICSTAKPPQTGKQGLAGTFSRTAHVDQS